MVKKNEFGRKQERIIGIDGNLDGTVYNSPSTSYAINAKAKHRNLTDCIVRCHGEQRDISTNDTACGSGSWG